MSKYLIGFGEDFRELLIVISETEELAKEKYINLIEPDEIFLEYLHDWSTNMSFSSDFYYDEESEGQEDSTQKEIQNKIDEYFHDKPNYAETHRKHWNDEIKGNKEECLMARFPDDMIFWIWRKELRTGTWTTLKIINLDKIEIMK